MPEILIHLGAYQGHINPDKAIPARFEHKNYKCHPTKFAEDIYDLDGRSVPLAPNLVLRKDLDGTKAPSFDGIEKPRPEHLANIPQAAKDKEVKRILSNNVFSPRAQPTMGEFNNITAPFFVDVDPKIVNKFKGVVYVSMACFNNDVILRQKNLRNTRYDVANDPAWHYQDNTVFEILQIVKSGVTDSPVETIDELNLVTEGIVLTL